MPPPPTARLTFSELSDDDAPFVLRLLNEPSFVANIRDSGVRTEEDARAYVANGPAASYAAHGFGLWRVDERAGGTSVGMCGVLRRDGLDDPDLGFAFLAEAQGRGYATEAGAATLAHARDALKLGRIVAIAAPHNAGSARVLEKLGFHDRGAIEIAGKPSRYFVNDPPPGTAAPTAAL